MAYNLAEGRYNMENEKQVIATKHEYPMGLTYFMIGFLFALPIGIAMTAYAFARSGLALALVLGILIGLFFVAFAIWWRIRKNQEPNQTIFLSPDKLTLSVAVGSTYREIPMANLKSIAVKNTILASSGKAGVRSAHTSYGRLEIRFRTEEGETKKIVSNSIEEVEKAQSTIAAFIPKDSK